MYFYIYFSNINTKYYAGEAVCQSFTWAQWDPKLQTLFYIHFRKALAPIDDLFSEKVEQTANKPTLSALQFHDELPHETVVSYFIIINME